MKRVLIVAGGSLLLVATPAFAHRLDEYLQAATISVAKDRVHVQMRLAPGVAVVPAVLALIDMNSDGVISDAEQRAYAQRMLRDLSLTVDGQRLPLRVVSSRFASVAELTKGLGEIHLELDAPLTSSGRNRQLVFENTHQARIAAYLVNSLVPLDPDIHIVSQQRDYRQSVYRLIYEETMMGSRSLSFGSLLRWTLVLAITAMVIFSQLMTRRRRLALTAR